MRVARGIDEWVFSTGTRVYNLCEALGFHYVEEIDHNPQGLAKLLEEAAAKM